MMKKSPSTPDKNDPYYLEKLLNKYHACKNIKTLTIKALLNFSPFDTKSEFTAFFKYPDKFYLQFDEMGTTYKEIINGERGVEISHGKRTVLTKKEIKKFRIDAWPYISDYSYKYRFQYLKEEKINGTLFDVVKIYEIYENEEIWVKFFFNRKTGLIEITERLYVIEGKKGLWREMNSNHKEIEGVAFPYTIKAYFDGKKYMEIEIKGIKINIPVDTNLFNLEKYD